MAEQKVIPNNETVYVQPGVQNQPSYRAVTAPQEWNHDIFGCFDGGLTADDNLCLKSTFCPCFVYGKQQERLRNPSLAGYERFNGDCMMWAGLQYCCGLGWVLQFIKRGELRSRFNLKGDTASDCLLSCCCGCCVLIQEERETVVKQSLAAGYNAPTGMSATPQQKA